MFRPREGETIVVSAGSLVTSLEKLGTHAGLSREHARRCLDYLERTHSVTLLRTHHWAMITITNWSVYQQSDEDARHTEHHAEHHGQSEDATHETPRRTPHAATPSKEVKNSNEKHTSNSGELDSNAAGDPQRRKQNTSRESSAIDPAVREWFEAAFWPLYPRHEGKQPALRAANVKATTPEKRAFYLDRLKSQLPAYMQRKSESGQRVIPMGATWFNQDRAEDELDSPQPESRGPRAVQNDYPDYVPLKSQAG